MTTYYEVSSPGPQNEPNWDDPTVWNQQSVPDSTNDGVILNQTSSGGGYTPPFNLTIKTGESFTIGSLNIANAFLSLNGTLSVASNINVSGNGEIDMANGSLSGSHVVLDGFQLGGSGTVTASGSLENQSLLFGDGLTVTGATIYNSGTLDASGGTLLVEATQAGGLLNFSNGTLSGGTYTASQGGTLDLKTGGVITTLAATIIYAEGAPVIASYNPASGAYVPIQVSLSTIAHAGVLDIFTSDYATPNWIQLDGTVSLDEGQLGAHGLTVKADGLITYTGNASSPTALSIDVGYVVNNGEITAVAGTPSNTSMVIQPVLRGTGSVVIGPEVTTNLNGAIYHSTVAIELQNAVSNSIVFSDGTGTLTLDTPQSFTGAFTGFEAGDSIVLSGIARSSVTGYSYSGDTTKGVLTIEEAGHEITLAFSGDYTTQNFTLTAGTGSSPSIVVGEVATTASAAHVGLVGVHAG